MKKQIEGVTVNGVKGVIVRSSVGKKPQITDVAEAIHSLKQRGIPLSDNPEALAERHCDAVFAVVQEHALFALACVEAAYNGDQKVFNQLYLQFAPDKRKKREAEKRKIKHRNSILPVFTTARALGKTPTALEVAEHMKTLGKSDAGNTDKTQIEKNLAKAGFVALPKEEKTKRQKTNVLSAHTSGKKTKRKIAPKNSRKKRPLE